MCFPFALFTICFLLTHTLPAPALCVTRWKRRARIFGVLHNAKIAQKLLKIVIWIMDLAGSYVWQQGTVLKQQNPTASFTYMSFL